MAVCLGNGGGASLGGRGATLARPRHNRIMRGILAVALLAISAAGQSKYNGPRPPKPDVPFLVHAGKLVETETAEAKEETRKDGTVYVISGPTSPAKTPMAEPILLMESQKLVPEKLELYKVDAKGGRREVYFTNKKKGGPRPFHISVTRLAQGLFRIEADEPLENGEYSLTPAGSNTVFCFQVY